MNLKLGAIIATAGILALTGCAASSTLPVDGGAVEQGMAAEVSIVANQIAVQANQLAQINKTTGDTVPLNDIVNDLIKTGGQLPPNLTTSETGTGIQIQPANNPTEENTVCLNTASDKVTVENGTC